MKITKDNIQLTHSGGQWHCELFIQCGFKYKNAWGWSESAKQAVNIALDRLK